MVLQCASPYTDDGLDYEFPMPSISIAFHACTLLVLFNVFIHGLYHYLNLWCEMCYSVVLLSSHSKMSVYHVCCHQCMVMLVASSCMAQTIISSPTFKGSVPWLLLFIGQTMVWILKYKTM